MSRANASAETGATVIDDDDLATLDKAISQVLFNEAGSLSLHQHLDGKIRLDRALWENAVELGWPRIGLPEEVGGLGFGERGLDLLHRQLGRRVAPGPFLATLSAAQTINDAADTETKSEWLPRLSEGECKLAVTTQTDTTSESSEIWVLGDENCEAFLAPLTNGDWGLLSMPQASAFQMWDRSRTMTKVDLGTSEPLAILPGTPTSQALARHLSLGIASDSIGGARAILEQTIAYMKEREQFDRPVASFQALKHRVADLMTLVVSGEEIVALAVQAVANRDPDADIWVKLGKARCTETYVHVASDCLQLHGGVGFTWEFDVHMYLNRARLNELLVAANTRLKDEAANALADAIRSGRQPLELA